MSYLFNLPDELKYTIFSLFDIQEITRLYSLEDSVLNSILNSSQYWIFKFNFESLPIFYNNNSYTGWLDEYIRIKKSIIKIKSKEDLKDMNLYYSDNVIVYLWCTVDSINNMDLVFSSMNNKQLIDKIYNKSINDRLRLDDSVIYRYSTNIFFFAIINNRKHLYYRDFSQFYKSDSGKGILFNAILITKDYDEIYYILLKLYFYNNIVTDVFSFILARLY